MKEFLLWWVGVEAVGLAAFPLAYAFFRWLPDRGYAFSKVIGLLLLGYGVWAGAVIGLFPYSRGSVILVLLGIAGLSLVIAGRHRDDLGRFVRSGSRYILFVEVLFFAVLASAVFIRSFAPEIIWGEKQFELAFLNSINRSEFFPPEDPWLAGHAISYYYFGFVIVSALSKLVALGTNVTFYLALSLMAALVSVTTFGLVYNMIAVSRRNRSASVDGPALLPRAAIFGLAASGLMLIVSNLEGIFELMARHGIGSEGFYGKVGIFGLDRTYDCAAAPAECGEWYPTRFWWWWKATRMGSPFDIQEFPFFSFQFGDLHPHVLVMPFLLTALAVALTLILGARAGREAGKNRSIGNFLALDAFPWRSLLLGVLLGGMILAAALALDVAPFLAVLVALVAAAVQAVVGAIAEGRPGEGDSQRLDALWWLRHPGRFLLVALLLGGIAFIDAWAVPLTVLSVAGAAIVANWLRAGGRPLSVLADSVGFVAPLVAAMFLFYLPFYLNLDTDTSIIPGVTQTAATGYPPPRSESTRPLHFLLVWAPLLWLGLSFAAFHAYFHRREIFRLSSLVPASLVWAVPVVVFALVILARDGLGGLGDEISERGPNLITLLILVVSITVVALSFFRHLGASPRARDVGHLFAFYLAGFAFLMMLGAEFYFVKDLFNWRVNTVFRFWHQSWIILAVVGGFGLYYLTLNWRLPGLRLTKAPWPAIASMGIVFGVGYTAFVAADPWNALYAKWWTATLGLFIGGASIIAFAVAAAVRDASGLVAWQRLSWLAVTAVILSAALVYPVTVTFERTGGFRNPQSLNGLVHVQRGDPGEYEAIQWLDRNVEGTPVVLEAVGDDFSDYSRVSARTGLPTVIGWPGHELQWRGYPSAYTTGPTVETPFTERPTEVETIYTTADVAQAKVLLEKYDVEYVIVGRFERERYGEAGFAKFREFLTPVFQKEGVTIYRVPAHAAAVARAD